MLRKLIKQDFLYSYKILVLVHLALIVFSIIGYFFISPLFAADSVVKENSALLVIIPTLYIIFIFIASYTSYILLTVRYYKSMYGQESYFTHTLPVSSGQLLLAKVIVFFIWSMITLICSIGCGFLLLLQPILKESDNILSVLFAGLDSFQMPRVLVILMILLLVFSATLFGILSIMGSINIGGFFFKQKIIASIIAYIIISLVTQLPFIFFPIVPSSAEMSDAIMAAQYFKNYIIFGIVFSLAGSSILAFISWYLPAKKLNLN